MIQATPQISPSESSSGLQEDFSKLKYEIGATEGRLAPLASIGSCSALSSIAESENRSLGSDSVFMNETLEEDDTDKDQNEEVLSSPKSEDDCTNKKYRIIPTMSSSSDTPVRKRRYSDSNALKMVADGARALPIVTNLVSNATNQITSTSLYRSKHQPASSSSSSTSAISYSDSPSTSSEKQRSGVFSRIAIIDVSESPTKTDVGKRLVINERMHLSKSEPKTINVLPEDPSTSNLKTLSLKDLMPSKLWNKETLF